MRNHAKILEKEAIPLAPYFIDSGHGYLQHASAELLGTRNMRLKVYLMPSGKPTLDDIGVSHWRALQLSAKPDEIWSIKEKCEIICLVDVDLK